MPADGEEEDTEEEEEIKRRARQPNVSGREVPRTALKRLGRAVTPSKKRAGGKFQEECIRATGCLPCQSEGTLDKTDGRHHSRECD